MATQAITGSTLICAGREIRRRAFAGDDIEFHKGMHDYSRRVLSQGEMLNVPAIDATLVCLEGELWLTRDGDIEDYILGAGSSLHLRRGDKATVQALRNSRVRLIPA